MISLFRVVSLLGILNLKNNLLGNFKEKDIQIINQFCAIFAHLLFEKAQNIRLQTISLTKETLGQYVSKNLVKNIEKSGDLQKRGEGEQKKAVCLFCDIRSFTAISSRLGPAKLVTLLNIYFSELIPIIEKYEGTVDKLVGDMIAAFWNLPYDVADCELKATKAAIEMQRVMIRKVVPKWTEAGVARIGIGIGLDVGPVIAGNIGSSQMLNYTVLGHVTQNAETLESLARPGEVIISERIQKIVEGKILQPEKILRNINFKGQDHPGKAFVLRAIDYPDY